jgi:type I restriction enzyme S subunit
MITATHKGKYYDVEYSMVNVSELEGELRIDAEYYEPFYLRNEEKIKRKKWEYLGDLLSEKPQYGTTPEGGIFEPSGIPFIRSQDFKEGFVDINQFCSFEFHLKNKKSNVIQKDILLAVVGATIGEVGLYMLEEEANINQNIARLRFNKLNPFYAFSFMKTQFFINQLYRFNTGNAQPYLNTFQVNSFKIPIPSDTFQNFQKFIEKLVLKAYEERQKAEQFYKEAEEILLEELGLKNWKPKTKKIKIGGREFEEEENISIRNLSEVIKADRMDAEYWEPKYDELIKKLKQKAILKSLKEFLASKLLKGVEVGSENYLENGIPFIRVSNISEFGIVGRDQKYISEELYLQLKDKFKPKKGEILLTKDATPGIAYVLKEDLKGIIASGIVRLKVENIEKEYLALVINSIIGQMQILKEGGGSIISHWKPNQIEFLLVPLIEPQTKKISQLIQQFFKARENSKKLLEIAKKTVEIYIEKDEEEGLNYANNQLEELNIKVD